MGVVFGPTVYLLGAGASAHAGAPLLRDFLAASRFVYHSGTSDSVPHYDNMRDLFAYLDRLRGVAYYMDSDFDNLEEVFSLLEMGRQLGRNDCVEQIANLRWAIFETLDATTRVRYKHERQVPNPLYAQFVELFMKLNAERGSRAQVPSLATISDTIVTFNYDVLLDHALEAAGARTSYGLGLDSGDGVKLLKLHGSLNWGSCKHCGSSPQVVSPSSDAWIGRPRGEAQRGLEVQLGLATRVLPATRCESCERMDTLEPVVVPPTWSKLIEGSPLVGVWNHAVQALATAYQVVIIGYSMPATDTFLRYLFALALQSNQWFNRVVVVNPDGSQELRQRYEKVFGRALGSRGKLEFVEGLDFARFTTGGKMAELGRNM